MGDIVKFPVEKSLTKGLRLVTENNRRWDAAAEALGRRDYDGFDRIMGERRWDPLNQGPGDAA